MDLICNGLNSAFNSGEALSRSMKVLATCNSNSLGAWDKILDWTEDIVRSYVWSLAYSFSFVLDVFEVKKRTYQL